jgi:hypothetical protein
MQIIKGMAALLLSLGLAACGGGGGDAGSSPFVGGGGGGGGTAVASDLTLTLDKTNVTNAGSETVVATVTAVDASRVAVSGVPVTIGVDNNAVVVVGSATTGADGKLTATINMGTDRSQRVITVTATSGSLTRTAAFQVTGPSIEATALPAVVQPGSPAQVQFRLVDINKNPMSGEAISVSGAGVTTADGQTGSNGEFTFNYTAPATSGNVEITAQAGGISKAVTVLVQSASSSIPAACAPAAPSCVLSPSVTANPSVVAVNTATTNNRSEIRALFLGAGNAPIRNVRVRFDLAGDANSIGGEMSSKDSLVYSDVNGVANSAYIPAGRSSPTDGVTIRACWDYVDFPAGTCPRAVTTTLTVIAEPLAVSIGTDNTITTGAGGLTYVKRYVVLVVDSSGQAKADVQISPSVDLLSYLKGFYAGPGAWTRDPLAGGSVSGACLNEDINRNGVIEAAEDDGVATPSPTGAIVEDNGNGTLEPRKSDVAISMVGGNRTNASGIAILQIEYPKNVATWVNFLITVAASGVSGTEGRATWLGQLGAAADEFTSDTPPSFVVSPYGTATSCANPG